MQSLSKYNKGISKYAWVVPIKDKKGTMECISENNFRKKEAK